MPFIKCAGDPHKYDDVRVNRLQLRDLISKASKSKDQGGFLLNGLIGLVFDTRTLAKSSGLGIKGSRKEEALDPIKVSAIKGTIMMLQQVVFSLFV